MVKDKVFVTSLDKIFLNLNDLEQERLNLLAEKKLKEMDCSVTCENRDKILRIMFRVVR